MSASEVQMIFLFQCTINVRIDFVILLVAEREQTKSDDQLIERQQDCPNPYDGLGTDLPQLGNTSQVTNNSTDC